MANTSFANPMGYSFSFGDRQIPHQFISPEDASLLTEDKTRVYFVKVHGSSTKFSVLFQECAYNVNCMRKNCRFVHSINCPVIVQKKDVVLGKTRFPKDKLIFLVFPKDRPERAKSNESGRSPNAPFSAEKEPKTHSRHSPTRLSGEPTFSPSPCGPIASPLALPAALMSPGATPFDLGSSAQADFKPVPSFSPRGGSASAPGVSSTAGFSSEAPASGVPSGICEVPLPLRTRSAPHPTAIPDQDADGVPGYIPQGPGRLVSSNDKIAIGVNPKGTGPIGRTVADEKKRS